MSAYSDLLAEIRDARGAAVTKNVAVNHVGLGLAQVAVLVKELRDPCSVLAGINPVAGANATAEDCDTLTVFGMQLVRINNPDIIKVCI